MTRRYFVDALPADGGPVTIGETESHHAIHVMRVRVGEAVTLFDGRGSQADATMRRSVEKKLFAVPSPYKASILKMRST